MTNELKTHPPEVARLIEAAEAVEDWLDGKDISPVLLRLNDDLAAALAQEPKASGS